MTCAICYTGKGTMFTLGGVERCTDHHQDYLDLTEHLKAMEGDWALRNLARRTELRGWATRFRSFPDTVNLDVVDLRKWLDSLAHAILLDSEEEQA